MSQNSTMSLTCIIVLISFFSKAGSGWCVDNFNWKGQTAQGIEDCDILKPKMTVHYGLLTNKPVCLVQVRVTTFDDKEGKEGRLLAHLGTPGHKNFAEFPNPLSDSERCKATDVRISAVIKQYGLLKRLHTTFSLNPNYCNTAADQLSAVSFARMCVGRVNSIATSTTTSAVNNNQTHTLNRRAAGGLSGKILHHFHFQHFHLSIPQKRE